MTVSLPKLLLLVGLTAVLTLVAVNLFSADDKRIRRKVEHQYGVADPQFVGAMGALLGPPLVQGNRTDTLVNGDRIFPAMLEAIRGAQRTISFETYIYWSGNIGKEFARRVRKMGFK